MRSGILNAASGVFIRVETVHKCPFGEWVSPFCHLHLPFVAARDGVAARELAERTLNEHDCCVDEFTDRLRKLAPTVDAMLSSTVLSALRHAAIDSQGTTLVTEVKHARRRAYRETRRQIREHRHVCAQFILREAMSLRPRSLRCGRPPSKPVRDCKTTRKKVCTGRRRAVLAYVNKRAAERRRQYGRTPKQAFKTLMRQWHEDFASLPPGDRRDFGEHLMCQLAEDDAQRADIAPQSSHTSLRAGHFGIGDEEHVVSMPHLHSYLSTLEEEFRVPVWQGTRHCLSMLSLRELADKAFPASDLELPDVSRELPAVPADYPSTKRCCNEKHYGFCVTRHAAIAGRVDNIAKRLKRLAERSKNAERPSLLFFNFGEAAAGRSFSLLWCQSLRQQSTQQSMHVFVQCSSPARQGDGSFLVSLFETVEAATLSFATSWMVAVRLCAEEVEFEVEELRYHVHPERLEWMVVSGRTILGRDWLASFPAVPPANKDSAAKALAALAKRSAKPAATGTAARPAESAPSTTEEVDRRRLRSLRVIEHQLALQATAPGPQDECEWLVEDGPDPSCAQRFGRLRERVGAAGPDVVVRVVETFVRWLA